ncbi:MAG: enoyl-CoA hydratase [Acidimicrobiia bacterium]
MSGEVLVGERGHVRTLTLHRPDVRNAMSSAMLRQLCTELLAAEDDPDVRVVILTGTDPAFTAGLDLVEVGRSGLDNFLTDDPKASPWAILHGMDTPVVAAVNGACVTGGLELLVQCSFAVASDRARFADTHARVGLHPGGGMLVLLPQAVGMRRAREMTFTGRFVDAYEAERIGLVNRVVPHDELLAHCGVVAAEIASCDRRTVAALNRSYRDIAEGTLGDGHALEVRRALEWKAEPADIEARRAAVIARGRHEPDAPKTT